MTPPRENCIISNQTLIDSGSANHIMVTSAVSISIPLVNNILETLPLCVTHPKPLVVLSSTKKAEHLSMFFYECYQILWDCISTFMNYHHRQEVNSNKCWYFPFVAILLVFTMLTESVFKHICSWLFQSVL